MSWLAVLALAWLVVAALAHRAHRRGSARLRRRWTTRLYAVTLVPLTALVLGTALVAIQLAWVDGIAVGEAGGAATPYAQWTALLANLVVSDMVLRRTGRGERPVRYRPGGRTAYAFTKPSSADLHRVRVRG